MSSLSLQEIVIFIHNGECGRAIPSLDQGAADESRPPVERIEYFKGLTECNTRLEDRQEAGNSFLEAIRIMLSQQMDGRSRAKLAIPLCENALGATSKMQIQWTFS